MQIPQNTIFFKFILELFSPYKLIILACKIVQGIYTGAEYLYELMEILNKASEWFYYSTIFSTG